MLAQSVSVVGFSPQRVTYGLRAPPFHSVILSFCLSEVCLIFAEYGFLQEPNDSTIKVLLNTFPVVVSNDVMLLIYPPASN